MCVCVLVRACVCYMFLHMQVCVEARKGCWMPSSATTFCFQAGSLTGIWGSPIRPDWLTSKPQGSSCLHLPSAGICNKLPYWVGFLSWFQGQNSGPHACTANILQTPHPQVLFLQDPEFFTGGLALINELIRFAGGQRRRGILSRPVRYCFLLQQFLLQPPIAPRPAFPSPIRTFRIKCSLVHQCHT